MIFSCEGRIVAHSEWPQLARVFQPCYSFPREYVLYVVVASPRSSVPLCCCLTVVRGKRCLPSRGQDRHLTRAQGASYLVDFRLLLLVRVQLDRFTAQVLGLDTWMRLPHFMRKCTVFSFCSVLTMRLSLFPYSVAVELQ